METAGITDIRNAFAGIFQQAAGLEKPDAVQVVHDRTAGGIAEKAAQMIFGDIKMRGNIIKAPDCTVILINIGDDFCNERGIFRTSLFSASEVLRIFSRQESSSRDRILTKAG